MLFAEPASPFGHDARHHPGHHPVPHAKEEAAARFAAATMGQGQGLKVGIVWAGSTKHLNDVDRTIGFRCCLHSSP